VPACKLGSAEITDRLTRLEGGTADDTTVPAIGGWCSGHGWQPVLPPVQERELVASILNAFADEVAEHLDQGRCPRPRVLPLPKIIDLDDGRVVYDEEYYRKQPDWTYVQSPG